MKALIASMLAFTVVFTLSLSARASSVEPIPHRDSRFEQDFQDFTLGQVGIVLQPNRREMRDNLKLLAFVMAEAVTTTRENIDINRMREIAVRIYQVAKTQARVPGYRREYRIAVALPAVLAGAFAGALVLQQNSEALRSRADHWPMLVGITGLVSAATFTLVAIFGKKTYFPHQMDRNSDSNSYFDAIAKLLRPITTAYFQPGEAIARGLRPISQREQDGLMRVFWQYFLSELEKRGHVLDIPDEKKTNITHMEQVASEAIGLPLGCPRLLVEATRE